MFRSASVFGGKPEGKGGCTPCGLPAHERIVRFRASFKALEGRSAVNLTLRPRSAREL